AALVGPAVAVVVDVVVAHLLASDLVAARVFAGTPGLKLRRPRTRLRPLVTIRRVRLRRRPVETLLSRAARARAILVDEAVQIFVEPVAAHLLYGCIRR